MSAGSGRPPTGRPAAGELTVAVGSAGAALARPGEDDDLVLDLGPRHPSMHGALRLRLRLEDDRIAEARPVVGYLHRGAEKLFEVRDYRQILVLANRHDWHSAFSSELGVVLAVERMLGIEVPARATWARMLLAELNRVLNHLSFLGGYPPELGSAQLGRVVPHAFRARETLQAVMEEVSGGRVHYMSNRVGGLREDLPLGWLGRVCAAVTEVRGRLDVLGDGLLSDEQLRAGTRGVGVLPAPLVDAYGVSGPVARASGVDLDLRRDDPYLAYADLVESGAMRVPTRREGDALARFEVLLEQSAVSLDLADACVDRLGTLPAGPVNVRLPKIVRPPEGSTYAWTENPLGINGYYLVSRGERTPWRLKLRSASFANISVLGELLRGCRVADLVAVLGSLLYVVGDIDR